MGEVIPFVRRETLRKVKEGVAHRNARTGKNESAAEHLKELVERMNRSEDE